MSEEQRLATVQAKIERETQYFTKWAEAAHSRYQILNISSISFGAAVPVIAILPGLWGGDVKASWVIAAAGIAGAIATLCRSIDGFLKPKESWLRSTGLLAKLRGERFLFEMRSGKYADATDALGLLATTIDGLVEEETASWTAVIKDPPRAI